MSTATKADANRASAQSPASNPADMTVIMLAGAAVLAISFGVRSIFGGVLEPISSEFGWSREVFSLSLAIQNLVWGAAQPIFGIIADKYGDRRALWLGFVCYLAGMILCVLGETPMLQHLGTGVLIGMGVSGTAFGVVLSVVGRNAAPEKRSQALGLATALGSSGQVLMPLLAAYLSAEYDWRTMLWVMTALILPMALFIPFLKSSPRPPTTPAQDAAADAGVLRILGAAFGSSSYVLLTLGFFVCGFHLAFVTVHFPAFVTQMCGDPALGLQALGLVGFTNIVGTFAAGQLGARLPKQYLLSAIYALRAVAIFLFITLPVTPTTVIIFALALGSLWLSTVPLTSGLVAGMFGPKYMATLYGFVFFSHQIGSFIGVWLGGWAYETYGSYDLVWWVGIALGVASAIAHLPVRERVHPLAA